MYKYTCSIFLIVGCFGTTQCIDDVQLGEKKDIPFNIGFPGYGEKKDGLFYPDGYIQNGEKKDFPLQPGYPGYVGNGQKQNGLFYPDGYIQNGEKKDFPLQPGFPGYIGNGQTPNGLFFPVGNIQNGEKKEFPLLPERRNKIERPCRVSDIACIQHYFEEHSRCKATHGMGPKAVRRAISNQFYPVINVTQINLDDKVTGLNTGRIQEFYVNRETDKLVLGLEFQGLTRESKNTFLKYHRRAREPVVTHGYTRVSFNSLYITVTIPQIKNLRLDKADIFGISNDVEPYFEMSASLGQSSDKTVQLANAEFLLKKPIVVSELLLTESPFYGATYIQYAICDFGLQLL